MAMATPGDVSELIAQWPDGTEVHERLMPMIYRDLRVIAARVFVNEKPNHTLQPTALVTEAYLRLSGGGPWQNRAHFFGAAARAMREALIDHARRKKSKKRGGMFERIPWDEMMTNEPSQFAEVLGMDRVICQLELYNPRWARIVELRFFAGLDIQEVSEVLQVGTATVRADWTKARVWLKARLETL